MFTTRHLNLHVAKVALKTEELKKDERFPVLAVGLVLEPLTHDLAKELGPEIAEHCFTRHGKIRDEMTRIQLRLREKPQHVTVQMAADAAPHCVLRHVRVPILTITKRELESGAAGSQTKRVAPQASTLRVTISCLVDPAEKVHREFFCSYINNFMLFSFDPEERDLFAERRADDDEAGEDADDGVQAPLPDADAGDVLDAAEAAPAPKKRGRPKLVRGKDASGPVH